MYKRQAKQSVQIGNKVNVKGELSLFEEARNPGNFDQKFYYEKQKIGAFLWAEALRVTDRESNPLKQGLYELRQKWKRILIDAAGEEDGGALAAILLGEKQGMDREIRELSVSYTHLMGVLRRKSGKCLPRFRR